MALSKSEKAALADRFNTDKPVKIIESEKVLERKLVKWVKEAGGKCIKLSSQFSTGLPDRMILFSNGRIFFCELKSTGKIPTSMQIITHKELRLLGFSVYVVDSTEQISEMLSHELKK